MAWHEKPRSSRESIKNSGAVKVFETQDSREFCLIGLVFMLWLIGHILSEILSGNHASEMIPIIDSMEIYVSTELRIIYQYLLLFMLLYVSWVSLVFFWEAIQDRNHILLFEEKIIFPQFVKYSRVKQISINYSDIELLKTSVLVLPGARLSTSLMSLYIQTNNGKKHSIQHAYTFRSGKGKKQLLEIFDFIKERVPAGTRLEEKMPR